MTPKERLDRIAQLLNEPEGWLVIKQADAQVIAELEHQLSALASPVGTPDAYDECLAAVAEMERTAASDPLAAPPRGPDEPTEAVVYLQAAAGGILAAKHKARAAQVVAPASPVGTREGEVREALAKAKAAIVEVGEQRRDCGVWGTECPLQDVGKSYHPFTEALTAIAAALAASPAPAPEPLVALVREWQDATRAVENQRLFEISLAADMRSVKAHDALLAHPLPEVTK